MKEREEWGVGMDSIVYARERKWVGEAKGVQKNRERWKCMRDEGLREE